MHCVFKPILFIIINTTSSIFKLPSAGQTAEDKNISVVQSECLTWKLETNELRLQRAEGVGVDHRPYAKPHLTLRSEKVSFMNHILLNLVHIRQKRIHTVFLGRLSTLLQLPHKHL